MIVYSILSHKFTEKLLSNFSCTGPGLCNQWINGKPKSFICICSIQTEFKNKNQWCTFVFVEDISSGVAHDASGWHHLIPVRLNQCFNDINITEKLQQNWID